MPEQHEWWQRGIVYQVYPRSFQDASGDGVGDLLGVRQRLDYLQWLGVDAVWLSPIYPSPMADFGYDVSDYCNIHPLFGDLDEFDRLLAETHRRGMKLILDFVPNHTSDQHPWFKESRSSRTSPKRDWYIWRDPSPVRPGSPQATGGPPNNWLSNFGGPAWRLDEATGQYYFHAFLKEQPDLNWRNPEVQHAMHDVLRFWMRRGVDGFRIDVIYHVIKDNEFRDNPRNPDYKPGMNPHHEFLATYIADRPEVHDIIAGMRKVVDEFPGRMLVGEVYLPIERLVMYYGEGGSGVHMPFNFQLITTKWDVGTIHDVIGRYERSLPPYGWPNWVLGNHDNPRIASRIGSAQARVAAILLLTLRGTPTLYYGDEIGMQDVPIAPHQVQDPFEKNVPGMGLGRDPERTPMQWDATANAGFTAAKPWLPLAPDYKTSNVAVQQEDPSSILSLYRKLIDLRRAEPALSVGSFELLPCEGEVLAYLRRYGGRTFLVVLNLGHEPAEFAKAGGELVGETAEVVLSTHGESIGRRIGTTVSLRGDEAVVIGVW
jgi:alpha-glucosidase